MLGLGEEVEGGAVDNGIEVPKAAVVNFGAVVPVLVDGGAVVKTAVDGRAVVAAAAVVSRAVDGRAVVLATVVPAGGGVDGGCEVCCV